MVNPTAPREGEEGAGDVDDDGRGPDEADDPPDDLPDTARGPAHVHVDPGGGTATDRTERAACESEGGAGIDEVGRARREVQDEAERSRTREVGQSRGREQARWRMDGRRRGLSKTISIPKRSPTT